MGRIKVWTSSESLSCIKQVCINALNLNSELYLSSGSSFNQRKHSEAAGKETFTTGWILCEVNQTRCSVSLQTNAAVQAKLICIFQEISLDCIVYPAAEDAFSITNRNVKWTKQIQIQSGYKPRCQMCQSKPVVDVDLEFLKPQKCFGDVSLSTSVVCPNKKLRMRLCVLYNDLPHLSKLIS